MYAVLNGAKIYFDITGLQYVTDGPVMRERPVCLCFAGGPGCSHIGYINNIAKLSEYMQMIFIDDRSTGKSERRDLSESTLEQNAADGEALRQYLGLDKIFVLGQSYGGMTAQKYAIDYQEHLHGLILISTAHNWQARPYENEVVMRRGNEAQKKIWKTYISGGDVDMGEFLHTMSSLYYYHYGPDEEREEEETKQRRVGWVNDDLSNYQVAHGLADFEYIEDLKKVTVPTIIFSGYDDFITSYEHSVEMHEVMPNSELHLLERCSHELYCDRPEYFYPHVREFVEKNFKPEG